MAGASGKSNALVTRITRGFNLVANSGPIKLHGSGGGGGGGGGARGAAAAAAAGGVVLLALPLLAEDGAGGLAAVVADVDAAAGSGAGGTVISCDGHKKCQRCSASSEPVGMSVAMNSLYQLLHCLFCEAAYTLSVISLLTVLRDAYLYQLLHYLMC